MQTVFRYWTAALLATVTTCTAVHANPVDCEMPQDDGERAICADPALHQLNGRLAELFHATFAGVPYVLHAAPGTDPMRWRRRLCGTDFTCLAAQYREALAGYEQPDASELDAVESLRKLVDGLREAHPRDAVEAAYSSIAVKTGIASFTSESAESGTTDVGRLPGRRPHDVSEDEWRALLASQLAETHEHGVVPSPLRYTLLDIDGDGKRDLVIDSERQYESGRLYAFRTLRRAGARFIPFNDTDAVASGATDPVYIPDDRDFHIFQNRWVRLNGRLFRFYSNDDKGIDEIYLLRPGRRLSQAPRLTIDYRYRLALVADAPIDPPARPSVDQALAEIYTARIRTAYTAPICAVPDSTPDDVNADNRSYSRPSSRLVYAVGDFPVNLAGVCYVSQLRDQRDSAGTMQWCMRLPSDVWAEQEECYDVHGSRIAVATLTETVPLLP
jgi:uncharacterized protein